MKKAEEMTLVSVNAGITNHYGKRKFILEASVFCRQGKPMRTPIRPVISDVVFVV